MAEDTIESYIEVMRQASEGTRAAIAQQLKDAGLYKGKVKGTFDIKLYTALATLGAELTIQRKFNKQFQLPEVSVSDFLLNKAQEGSAESDGTGKGPTTTRQTYVTSASQTAKLLDTVAQDLLERKLTKAEKAKYLKIVNAEQKRQPSIQTSGKGFTTTQGGVDEQALIEEKIGATKEAKNVRATDAYAIMMEELGGLR